MGGEDTGQTLTRPAEDAQQARPCHRSCLAAPLALGDKGRGGTWPQQWGGGRREGAGVFTPQQQQRTRSLAPHNLVLLLQHVENLPEAGPSRRIGLRGAL